MAKYILKFCKEGYMKYTSHLDMMRLFMRTFKRTGLDLQYSQGFNPHPKLGFAQPLSLGYTSIGELMDFDTKEDHEPAEIMEKLNEIMPEGITVTECRRGKDGEKSAAARCTAAEYIIAVPIEGTINPKVADTDDFLGQETITVKKKKKKSREFKDVDIKGMIRELSVYVADDKIFLSTTLDAGSGSNLSPELLLQGFMAWADLPLHRENVEILRKKIIL
ncbi:MAG: TIGR03936 family radical SAM-associated protein [Eubacteriaceae bacterium]|nr:TIGR03936 family radical SAM-associated protein [Eubacteriaceae bacterium]